MKPRLTTERAFLSAQVIVELMKEMLAVYKQVAAKDKKTVEPLPGSAGANEYMMSALARCHQLTQVDTSICPSVSGQEFEIVDPIW
jgi:hypothetical protein